MQLGEPEAERHMALAGAAVADRDDVLPAEHVLRAGRLQHQCPVERGQRGEVEAVEAFDRWEPRLLDPPLDHPPFALDQLEFGQAQQVADQTLDLALVVAFAGPAEPVLEQVMRL